MREIGLVLSAGYLEELECQTIRQLQHIDIVHTWAWACASEESSLNKGMSFVYGGVRSEGQV